MKHKSTNHLTTIYGMVWEWRYLSSQLQFIKTRTPSSFQFHFTVLITTHTHSTRAGRLSNARMNIEYLINLLSSIMLTARISNCRINECDSWIRRYWTVRQFYYVNYWLNFFVWNIRPSTISYFPDDVNWIMIKLFKLNYWSLANKREIYICNLTKNT